MYDRVLATATDTLQAFLDGREPFTGTPADLADRAIEWAATEILPRLTAKFVGDAWEIIGFADDLPTLADALIAMEEIQEAAALAYAAAYGVPADVDTVPTATILAWSKA